MEQSSHYKADKSFGYSRTLRPLMNKSSTERIFTKCGSEESNEIHLCTSAHIGELHNWGAAPSVTRLMKTRTM
jgi:hypothetical protein